MRVALVFPRFKYPTGDPPVGLTYIAGSILKHTKAEVDIIDTTFAADPLQHIEDAFKKHKYEVAGFSVMTASLRDADKAAALIKKVSPQTKIIYGGPHPSVMPDKSIQNPLIDGIALAEGEDTFVEIVKKKGKFKNVAGLWYKEDGKIIRNMPRALEQDIDTIPFPARHLVDMERYIKNWYQMDIVDYKLRGTGIMASRGCSYRCSFCQPTLDKMFGKKMRKRSAKNIVDELEMLQKEYGMNSFIFLDDTFTLDPKWVHEVCDELIARDVNYKWGCNSRTHLVTESMFTKMKQAGLSKVYIGMESGSQRVLDEVYQKDIKIDHIYRATKILKKLGVRMQGYFMMGAPSETLTDIKQTINFAKSLPIEEATFSVTTPLPETYLYERSKHLIKGAIEDMDYYKVPVYQAGTVLPARTINYYKKRALLEFYLHPKRFASTMKLLMGGRKALEKLKRF
jgi:anaerobic magnesium-protoporphyrin IX monomethyl ester cyclase